MDGWGIALGLAGIAGTVFAAIFGAKRGVLWADKKNKDFQRDKETQEVANFRKALLTEIETIESRYRAGMGDTLEKHPPNQPFFYIYPTGQRYFVIFEENAHLIGLIPDDRERELIVQVYTQAKGLLDSFQYNNSRVEKYEYAVGLGPAVLGQNAAPVVTALHQAMIAYTPILQKMHHEVLQIVHELKALLRRPIGDTTKGERT